MFVIDLIDIVLEIKTCVSRDWDASKEIPKSQRTSVGSLCWKIQMREHFPRPLYLSERGPLSLSLTSHIHWRPGLRAFVVQGEWEFPFPTILSRIPASHSRSRKLGVFHSSEYISRDLCSWLPSPEREFPFPTCSTSTSCKLLYPFSLWEIWSKYQEYQRSWATN